MSQDTLPHAPRQGATVVWWAAGSDQANFLTNERGVVELLRKCPRDAVAIGQELLPDGSCGLRFKVRSAAVPRIFSVLEMTVEAH